MGFEEDLASIEGLIRQLGVEWEKFFGGVEKKPPTDLRMKVEAIIRRHSNLEIKNATDRFRYQSMTARYNTFSELWSKRLRLKEEGKVFGMHGLKAEVLPPPSAPSPVASASGATAGGRKVEASEVRVSDPDRDAAAVRSLYDRFMAARAASGETAPVKYDSFQKLIGQQASRLLTEKGGQAVDFRLETRDGKVSLKAKVVK